jgi:hypothetical protein
LGHQREPFRQRRVYWVNPFGVKDLVISRTSASARPTPTPSSTQPASRCASFLFVWKNCPQRNREEKARIMPNTPQPEQPIPVPKPDVVRPPTPLEEPQPDKGPDLPQPDPDVVVPPAPEVITPSQPQEIPSTLPA